LRKPISEACGNGQCITVTRSPDSTFDVTLLTAENCDSVTSIVGAEGIGETQAVSVERGGTMQLRVSPDCGGVPQEPDTSLAPDDGEPA
jgi:hypothetical protein